MWRSAFLMPFAELMVICMVPKVEPGTGGTFKLRYVFKAIGNTLCKYVVTEYSCQIIAKRDKTDKGQESYKQKR